MERDSLQIEAFPRLVRTVSPAMEREMTMTAVDETEL